MLESHEIPFRYREYREEPLDEQEIRSVLAKLGMEARDLLRTKDRAFGESGLSGDASDDEIVAAMAEHPTLLQRPIGITGSRAAVGRPPEKLLSLTGG